MQEQEEVAYIVRKFDEIANDPKPAAQKGRSFFVPALFLITVIIIIIVSVLYYRKNGIPKIPNPFSKKTKPSPKAELTSPASKSIETSQAKSVPLQGKT